MASDRTGARPRRTVGASVNPGPALRRSAPFVAWSGLGLTILWLVLLAALGVSNAEAVSSSTSGAEIIWVLSWLGFGLVGALLASRRPENPIGWTLLGIPFLLYLGLLLAEYAVRGLVVAPGSLPLALVAGWVSKWSMIPGLGLLLLLLLLFPGGRIEGRWMRRAAVATGGVVVVLTGLVAIEPKPIRGDLDIANPLAVTAFGDATVTAAYVAGYALAALALVIGANTVLRWRRARGLERQQFRWFASAVAAFPVMFVLTVMVSDGVGASWSWDPVVLAFFFGMNGIAAAIGIAVMRYRLYDIDRVVSRTVSYALLTALLIGVYAAGVIGLGGLVRAVGGGGGGDLVVAAATLAAAALFGPARRRIQATVDRRFNRARYDAQRIVEEFAQRLRDEVDLEALSAELRETATATVAPRSTSLWLRAGEVAR
jgi:hypothetical protein